MIVGLNEKYQLLDGLRISRSTTGPQGQVPMNVPGYRDNIELIQKCVSDSSENNNKHFLHTLNRTFPNSSKLLDRRHSISL